MHFFTVQVAKHKNSAQRSCGVSSPGISKRCLGTVLSSVLWGILFEQGGWIRWLPVVLPPWPSLWWGCIPAEVPAILSDHPEENSYPAQAALAEQASHGVGAVTLDFHILSIPSTGYRSRSWLWGKGEGKGSLGTALGAQQSDRGKLIKARPSSLFETPVIQLKHYQKHNC